MFTCFDQRRLMCSPKDRNYAYDEGHDVLCSHLSDTIQRYLALSTEASVPNFPIITPLSRWIVLLALAVDAAIICSRMSIKRTVSIRRRTFFFPPSVSHNRPSLPLNLYYRSFLAASQQTYRPPPLSAPLLSLPISDSPSPSIHTCCTVVTRMTMMAMKLHGSLLSPRFRYSKKPSATERGTIRPFRP